eukprot:14729056-Heterocapsa_arctica.AAC.1
MPHRDIPNGPSSSTSTDACQRAPPMQPPRPLGCASMEGITIWEAIGSPPPRRTISSNRAPLW